MDTIRWLLLVYRIPAEPAAPRVSVWRRLKGMGAVYLQGGVCLLPRTDDHLRRLKIVENDIAAAGGEAVLLDTAGLDAGQQEKVVARFRADRADAYDELIDKCDDFERDIAKEIDASHLTFAELEENDADLRKLQDWLRRIESLDFYGGGKADEARARVSGCAALLDDFARRVYAAEEQDRNPSA